ncbi:hypothetical protein JB92DRAFT_2827911 [Gautieria morchelliformis]|nr:hypothetical protein JB92DRAFT_2827911 [Gautieria morchelliformis]
MSPEILLGTPYYLPTDLFSLGVVFSDIAARRLADDAQVSRMTLEVERKPAEQSTSSEPASRTTSSFESPSDYSATVELASSQIADESQPPSPSQPGPPSRETDDLAGATSELCIEPGDMFFAKMQRACIVALHCEKDEIVNLEIRDENTFFTFKCFAKLYVFWNVLDIRRHEDKGSLLVTCACHTLRGGPRVAHGVGRRDTSPEAVWDLHWQLQHALPHAALAAAFPNLLDAGMQWYLHRNSMTSQTAIFITFHWIFHWLWVHKSQKIRLLAQALTNEKWRRNHRVSVVLVWTMQ